MEDKNAVILPLQKSLSPTCMSEHFQNGVAPSTAQPCSSFNF